MARSPFRVQQHLEAFDGGLNNKYEPSIIGENESADCLNVTFDDLGAVQTREGSTKFNTTSVGSLACDGLYTANYNDGTEEMIAWYGGTAWSLTGTSTFTTIGSGQSIYTSGTRVEHTMYQNYVFAGNGQQAYKYDGTDFTRHGVEVPNSLPGAATGAAGNPNGDYQYKIVYRNSALVEGNPSSATATITVSSEQIDLTSIPVAPQSFGVAARRIYRTEAGGTTFKLLTTLADNTTTTYTDNTADSGLGANAPSDNGLPPNWHIVKSFQERIWCVDTATNPQYLYYSELGEPFTFGSANFIKIADGDGEAIVGLGIQGNALVVYKEESVWLIYMPDTTPGNWQRVKTNSKYGGTSHRAIVDYSKLQMYFGQQGGIPTGFYALSGTDNSPDGTLLNSTAMFGDAKSDRIEPDVFLMQSAYKANVAAIQYKNKLYFAVTYGSGNTTNNRIYEFDFHRRDQGRTIGSWVPWDGLNAAVFTIYGGSLYFGSSTANGFVYKLLDGTYADDGGGTDGTAINSYYWTKEFEGPSTADSEMEKDYRYVNFILQTLGNWIVGVTHRVDSDIGDGDITEVNVNPGGSQWSSMVWGSDEWGGGVTRANFKIELGTKVGKKIQFKFDNRNTAGRAFKVLRGDIYFNRRGLR